MASSYDINNRNNALNLALMYQRQKQDGPYGPIDDEQVLSVARKFYRFLTATETTEANKDALVKLRGRNYECQFCKTTVIPMVTESGVSYIDEKQSSVCMTSDRTGNTYHHPEGLPFPGRPSV